MFGPIARRIGRTRSRTAASRVSSVARAPVLRSSAPRVSAPWRATSASGDLRSRRCGLRLSPRSSAPLRSGGVALAPLSAGVRRFLWVLARGEPGSSLGCLSAKPNPVSPLGPRVGGRRRLRGGGPVTRAAPGRVCPRPGARPVCAARGALPATAVRASRAVDRPARIRPGLPASGGVGPGFPPALPAGLAPAWRSLALGFLRDRGKRSGLRSLGLPDVAETDKAY